MSLFFVLNNFHFAFELIGALAFLMLAWLFWDAYLIRKNTLILTRSIGLGLLTLYQIIHAFNLIGDLANYLNALLYLAGLAMVAVSMLPDAKNFRLNTVIILPPFYNYRFIFSALAALGLGAIAALSFWRYKQEKNKALFPFWLGFALISLAEALAIFSDHRSTDILWLLEHALLLAGFLCFVWYVWQYLRLRVRESMILIFVAIVFFMATAVTLAFSTIFMANIEATTEASLLTNAKVLNYAISRLEEEALAKTRWLAEREDLRQALNSNNFTALEQLATSYLEKEQLGFLLVADANGDVILRAHALTQKDDSVAGEKAVAQALKGQPSVTIENSSGEKFSIRSAVPIVSNNREIKEVLVGGFLLDNAMVDGIQRITGLDMSIFEGNTRVATTILNADGRTRSLGVKENNSQVLNQVLNKGEAVTRRVNLLSQQFLVSYFPLRNDDGKIIGMISAAKPQQEIIEIANATNRLTFITVIILMLILIAPVYLATKHLAEKSI